MLICFLVDVDVALRKISGTEITKKALLMYL